MRLVLALLGCGVGLRSVGGSVVTAVTTVVLAATTTILRTRSITLVTVVLVRAAVASGIATEILTRDATTRTLTVCLGRGRVIAAIGTGPTAAGGTIGIASCSTEVDFLDAAHTVVLA